MLRRNPRLKPSGSETSGYTLAVVVEWSHIYLYVDLYLGTVDNDGTPLDLPQVSQRRHNGSLY